MAEFSVEKQGKCVEKIYHIWMKFNLSLEKIPQEERRNISLTIFVNKCSKFYFICLYKSLKRMKRRSVFLCFDFLMMFVSCAFYCYLSTEFQIFCK